MRVSVRLAPDAGPIDPAATAVVIDVLRATSTLTEAFAHGAARVIPVPTPEAAFRLKRDDPAVLLCGERGGRMIEGFDLGNSPLEYPPDVVSGRTLVFASTNGAQAMSRARAARRCLLAAFTNLAAAAEALHGAQSVVVLCAGKLGGFCLEDAACAGMLCARLEGAGARPDGAGARFARTLAPADAAGVRALLEGCGHGRTLRGMGADYARDVTFCAGLDRRDRAFEL